MERGKHVPIVGALLFLLLVTAPAVSDDLKQDIRRLHQKYDIEREDAGIAVVSASSGRTMYRQNFDRAFIPASNMKIITAIAALRILGTDFQFRTRLYLDKTGNREENSHLYVQGGGDPTFSRRFHEDRTSVFREWARSLKREGLTELSGNLYLDDSLYEAPVIHPSWRRYKLSYWYTAPVSPLIFNDNCVYVRVLPQNPGEPARVPVKPEGSPVNIVNETKTVPSKSRAHITIKRIPGTWNIKVSGRIRPNTARREWITVPDPAQFFGTILKRVLQQEGIPVRGDVQTKPVPEELQNHNPDLTRKTPLNKPLNVMMKKSQNLYAETIFKQIAYRQTGVGSWENGSRAIRKTLDQQDIPTQNCRIVDGSGLSRKNRLTPKAIVSALQWWLRQDQLKESMTYLPVAGQDGTLEHRLNELPYRGRIAAKTGTLDGVISLSGVAGTEHPSGDDERKILFSVLINQSEHSNGQARKFADDVARIAYDLVRNRSR